MTPKDKLVKQKLMDSTKSIYEFKKQWDRYKKSKKFVKSLGLQIDRSRNNG